MVPGIDHVAPKDTKKLKAHLMLALFETLKDGETPSRLDLRSFHVLRHFAFSNLSGTVVKQYLIL